MNSFRFNYNVSLLFLSVTSPFIIIFYLANFQSLIKYVVLFVFGFVVLHYFSRQQKYVSHVSIGLVVNGLAALYFFSTILQPNYGIEFIYISFSAILHILIRNEKMWIKIFLGVLVYILFYNHIFSYYEPNLMYLSMTFVSFIMGIGIVYIYNMSLNRTILQLNLINTELEEINKEIQIKAKLSTEYKIARDIQEQYLQKQKFDLPTYSLDFIYQPSHEISGDFFDFRPIGKNKIAVLVVDVQGKGLESSFVAIRISSIFHSMISAENSPKEALGILNRELYNISAKKMISVAYYLELNYQTNTIRYADAGMAIATIVRGNELIEIKEFGGLPLGAYQKSEYTQGELKLEERDSIIISTDGLVDMINVDNERFGYDNLEHYLINFNSNHKFERNLTLKEYIEETVVNYKNTNHSKQDDLAVVCIEHLSSSFIN